MCAAAFNAAADGQNCSAPARIQAPAWHACRSFAARLPHLVITGEGRADEARFDVRTLYPGNPAVLLAAEANLDDADTS